MPPQTSRHFLVRFSHFNDNKGLDVLPFLHFVTIPLATAFSRCDILMQGTIRPFHHYAHPSVLKKRPEVGASEALPRPHMALCYESMASMVNSPDSIH